MDNNERDKRVANTVEKLYKTEQYSLSKRGEIINLTTKIENTLTDIFACIFCPENFSSDVKANKSLNKERIELKSLLLNKINFRYKIESLKDILLVKKPDILESNKAFIKTLLKELDKVREFRNIIAHSELNILSSEFIRELNRNKDVKIDKFQIIEYKKGKAILHLINEASINTEINTMQGVLFKLQKLHFLIQGNIKMVNALERLYNLPSD